MNENEPDRALEEVLRLRHQLMPTERPDVDHYDLQGWLRQADNLDSDFFGFGKLGDGRLAVFQGSCVGFGYASAMYYVLTITELRHVLADSTSVSEVLTRLNRGLTTYDLGRFAALNLLALNTMDHVATVAIAGEGPPVVVGASGQLIERNEESVGPPLGVIDDFIYEEQSFELGVGDSVWMTTDGLPDLLDRESRMFGIERLDRILQRSDLELSEIMKNLKTEVEAHADRFDEDLCVVAMRRLA